MAERYASLKQGLVGCWIPSVSGSGFLLPDLSGRGNNGTLTNMASDDWVSSQYGRALDFDGTDDEVRAQAPTISTTYCVSVWVKATTGNFSGLITLSADASNLGADLYLNSSGTVVFYCPSTNNGSARSFFTTTNAITSGQWVHLVGRWQAGLINDIYVNGVLAQGTLTGSVQSLLTTRTILSLGGRQGVNNWLTGQLDDARCYNRLLTESEIKLLASRPGIGLRQDRDRQTFYQFPSGSRRRLLLTGQT